MSCKCDCDKSGGAGKLAALAVAGVVVLAGAHAGHGTKHAGHALAAVVTDAARGSASSQGARAVAYARARLGRPYVWGGTGPPQYAGFDCSGLAMMAWRAAGVDIARTTFAQWPELHHVSRGDLRPGDLVFFAGSDGTQSNPGHVVIYIGGDQVIQAWGSGTSVKVSPLGDVNAGPLTGYARPGGA